MLHIEQPAKLGGTYTKTFITPVTLSYQGVTLRGERISFSHVESCA